MEITTFMFNPFMENTYVLHDSTKECVIIDPGCYTQIEEDTLLSFIEDHELKPTLLLNTHCHIDHIFGNYMIYKRFQLDLHAHEEEEKVIAFASSSAQMYGLNYTNSPNIKHYIQPGVDITFGNTTLQVAFTPGHSPGSVCFLHQKSKSAIVGDVLFLDSIGRTDLPGGDYDTLISSIKTELLSLDDDWKIFNGHGPSTTIGRERKSNPFLQG